MYKKEFIGRVTDLLRDNGVRKPIKSRKKHIFRITDDSGNAAKFIMNEKDKQVIYTLDDVSAVIDACLAVIEDSIKHGEEVNFKGFGVLGVHYRKARRTKQPGTEEWYEVDARYVPKFTYGNTLRVAARLYEMSLEDADKYKEIPPLISDDELREDDD